MRRVVCFGLLALLGSAVAYILGSYVAGLFRSSTPAVSGSQPPTPLVIEPSSLRLGQVWESTGQVVELTVQNTTSRPITVRQFRSGCSCSDISPETISLAPHATGSVKIRINTSHRLPHHRGVERWPLSVAITALLDDPEVPEQSWEVTGTVWAWASAERGWLDFDDRCQQGGPPYTRTLRYKRHAEFDRLEATVDPTQGTVAVRPVPGVEGEFEVAVTPNPDGVIGPFSFEVRLEAVRGGGARHPISPLPVRGQRQPPAHLVPRMVLLGEHPLDSLAEGEIELHLPPEGWRVKQIECGCPELRIAEVPDAPPGVRRYSIGQRIASLGDLRAEVKFVLTGPYGETVRVTTEVLAFGSPKGK